MTNAEKLKKHMDERDCVYFYCYRHYCGDCPVHGVNGKVSCQDLLEEWMRQKAKDDE